MNESEDEFAKFLMDTMETAFRHGFRAAAHRLGWSEDEAWSHARDRFAPMVERLVSKPGASA